MPYASDAQRRLFHAKEARGEISAKTVHEFDKASKGKKLPEHVKGKHHMSHEKEHYGHHGPKSKGMGTDGGAPGSHDHTRKENANGKKSVNHAIHVGHPKELESYDEPSDE